MSVKRVSVVTDAAKKMAQGDLSIEIKDSSRDEIGQLGAALAETTSTLNDYITDLSGNLGKMAQGNLRIERTVEFKGDFVKLEESMRNIAHSLNDMLTQINQVSEQVSSGSNQVSTSSQALAQGATEQCNIWTLYILLFL